MSSNIHQLLTRYWGHATFRPLQEDIIRSVLDGKDTLALLPTGGGKSICFQVPGLALEGMCLVISPLIALMKDQVERLQSKELPAHAIISGMSRKEIDAVLEKCAYGKVKFLYVSPERLSSDLFLARLERMKISLIAVDEAHCISQWGYDFRPSYLQIAAIREHLPGVPVLALTATATPEVEKDIQDKLKFNAYCALKKSFERKNLSYVVLHTDDKPARMLKVIKGVGGSGIVYVRNRKRTRELCEYLTRNGISASFYHAGLTMDEREMVQHEWMKGKKQVMVSTNAFGMGIDKSDVRFVLHMDLPESPEAYFQEAGRAGRDEQKAYAVLLYSDSDRAELERRAAIEFPSLPEIKQVYAAIGNYLQLPVGSGKGASFDFDVNAIGQQYDLKSAMILSSVKTLELQGLLAYSDTPGFHSRIHFLVKPDQLYEFQVKNPALDRFVRILLRSYEGLFSDYVQLREKEVAARCSIPVVEAVAHLRKLHQLQVIDYRPATDEPQLTFTEERLDAKDLYIDREHLSERKRRFMERAEAMLRYATDTETCRSLSLLHYFGETAPTRCGVCDSCLERNKSEMSDLEFGQAESKIVGLIGNGTSNIRELIPLLQPISEAKALNVIGWLLEHGKIRYRNADELELCSS